MFPRPLPGNPDADPDCPALLTSRVTSVTWWYAVVEIAVNTVSVILITDNSTCSITFSAVNANSSAKLQCTMPRVLVQQSGLEPPKTVKFLARSRRCETPSSRWSKRSSRWNRSEAVWLGTESHEACRSRPSQTTRAVGGSRSLQGFLLGSKPYSECRSIYSGPYYLPRCAFRPTPVRSVSLHWQVPRKTGSLFVE